MTAVEHRLFPGELVVPVGVASLKEIADLEVRPVGAQGV